ncbi:hypothetical protein RRG08_043539 [Elysia crispata]|uniref:Uncharacterized protein n=1 Tax=Elysia crispata TaxID=231223 RepID=A0AAE0YFU6_9GAST|nr:hypothetical protein RRG08_043539 [Elysia crispata]
MPPLMADRQHGFWARGECSTVWISDSGDWVRQVNVSALRVYQPGVSTDRFYRGVACLRHAKSVRCECGRCGVSASLSQCSTGEQRTKCLARGGVEGFRLSASGSGNPSKSSSSWPLATFSHPLDASFSPCTCSPYLLGQSLSEAHGVVRHLERSDHANGIFSALWIVASRTPTGCPNTGIKGGRRALGLLALQLSHSKYLNSGGDDDTPRILAVAIGPRSGSEQARRIRVGESPATSPDSRSQVAETITSYTLGLSCR